MDENYSEILHPIEKEILSHISLDSKFIAFDDLKEQVDLNKYQDKLTQSGIDQLRRGLEWLKHKNFIKIEYIPSNVIISLDEYGLKSIDIGLPERRLVNAIINGYDQLSIILEKKILEKNEINPAIFNAKKLGWIEFSNNSDRKIILLKNNITSSNEELLLKKISDRNIIELKNLNKNEQKTLKNLVNRPKYVNIKKEEKILIKLTEHGKKIKKNLSDTLKDIKVDKLASTTHSIDVKEKTIDVNNTPQSSSVVQLTSELIKSGKWKTVNFRPINVEANVPFTIPGRTHPLVDLIREIRDIFVSLGFTEIEGNYTQNAFWNFDVLYTPQDHPAREMQDTFYLSEVNYSKSIDSSLVTNVSNVHENGWNYKWSLSDAKKMVLRTHTTPITLRYLSQNPEEESRIFTIGRVFRNEKVSYKHLIEFNQVEGVLHSKKISLRDLMGIQIEFYKRLGIKKIKFWPTFFPYTEPSLQSMIYNDKLHKWIELFGMGIFRPEVTKPLGIKNKVLAWGGGIERIAMLKYNLSDVRDLYNNKIEWLRSLSKCQL
ncbi:MAG: phenylalanine--tRNA ligase subunit alpha [Nitrososphaeraceae archaeon]